MFHLFISTTPSISYRSVLPSLFTNGLCFQVLDRKTDSEWYSPIFMSGSWRIPQQLGKYYSAVLYQSNIQYMSLSTSRFFEVVLGVWVGFFCCYWICLFVKWFAILLWLSALVWIGVLFVWLVFFFYFSFILGLVFFMFYVESLKILEVRVLVFFSLSWSDLGFWPTALLNLGHILLLLLKSLSRSKQSQL